MKQTNSEINFQINEQHGWKKSSLIKFVTIVKLLVLIFIGFAGGDITKPLPLAALFFTFTPNLFRAEKKYIQL